MTLLKKESFFKSGNGNLARNNKIPNSSFTGEFLFLAEISQQNPMEATASYI